jgi:hypothetical protein
MMLRRLSDENRLPDYGKIEVNEVTKEIDAGAQ